MCVYTDSVLDTIELCVIKQTYVVFLVICWLLFALISYCSYNHDWLIGCFIIISNTAPNCINTVFVT